MTPLYSIMFYRTLRNTICSRFRLVLVFGHAYTSHSTHISICAHGSKKSEKFPFLHVLMAKWILIIWIDQHVTSIYVSSMIL